VGSRCREAKAWREARLTAGKGRETAKRLDAKKQAVNRAAFLRRIAKRKALRALCLPLRARLEEPLARLLSLRQEAQPSVTACLELAKEFEGIRADVEDVERGDADAAGICALQNLSAEILEHTGECELFAAMASRGRQPRSPSPPLRAVGHGLAPARPSALFPSGGGGSRPGAPPAALPSFMSPQASANSRPRRQFHRSPSTPLRALCPPGRAASRSDGPAGALPGFMSPPASANSQPRRQFPPRAHQPRRSRSRGSRQLQAAARGAQ
jgi:hypothetical protein